MRALSFSKLPLTFIMGNYPQGNVKIERGKKGKVAREKLGGDVTKSLKCCRDSTL